MSKAEAKTAQVKHITVGELKEALQNEQSESGADFINVCTPAEYQEKHIKGVRNVPLDSLDEHVSELQDKQTVYIHCNSGNRSQKAIDTLKEQLPNVQLVNVQGGLMAWEEANYPTNSLTNRLPLMRQVMLAAGSLILLGFGLAFAVHEWFLAIPAFVGVGLFVSGSTGWCGMALLLSRMPWNQ